MIRLSRKTVIRGGAVLAILIGAPITASRANGVTANDGQCQGLESTCCDDFASTCCSGLVDTCIDHKYDKGTGRCGT